MSKILEMENTVKMAEMPMRIATWVFEMLNRGKVQVWIPEGPMSTYKIYTDVDPEKLIYPEGWIYKNGEFRQIKRKYSVKEEAIFFTMDEKKWTSVEAKSA